MNNRSRSTHKRTALLHHSRSLATTITAAIILAAATAVHAVNLNHRGLGEVLLFPYYTTNGKYDTYINLVNTRDETKAVKIRFREAMNGAVVLEMNLYLAPRDHWSAVIYPNPEGPGVQLRSADRSCTLPLAIQRGEPVQLSNQNYVGDSNSGFERTQEGFVEVIEMAVLEPGSLDWPDKIKYRLTGNRRNCETLATAWEPGGIWNGAPADGAFSGTGGLYGYGVLIDVEEGTEAAYNAVAIENFTTSGGSLMHTAPDSPLPNLNSGDTQYQILNEGYLAGTAFSGIDAVSAILMMARINNDYVLEPSIGANTDWVITFPTKHEYVNGETARAPFTSTWNRAESMACESFSVIYRDRERQRPLVPPNPPMLPAPPLLELCAQANVLSFNGSSSGSGVLEADYNRNAFLFFLDYGFDNGWAEISFDSTFPRKLTAAPLTFTGLPAVGFALHKYVNGSVQLNGNTVLSNYVGLVQHKGQIILGNP